MAKNEITREEWISFLKSVDWFYLYAEGDLYRSGKRQAEKISEIRVKNSHLPFVEEEFNKYKK